MGIDKRHLFLLFAVLLGAFLLVKMKPATCPPLIKAKIIAQRGSINSLNTPRAPASTVTYYLDTLSFTQGASLNHKTLGPLGFTNDFFIDAEAKIDVLKPGLYTFDIASDDGFRLMIDNTVVTEFLTDRPISHSKGSVYLSKGTHRLLLNYFQGFGQLALVGYYLTADGKKFLIGDSSPFIEFLPWSVAQGDS